MSWSGMENLHRSRWVTELCQLKIRCIGTAGVVLLAVVPIYSWYQNCPTMTV